MRYWIIILILIFSCKSIGQTKSNSVGQLKACYLEQTNKKGSASFQVTRGGHFIVKSKVNKFPVRFLFDTGATKVTLSAKDATKLGIDLENLKYNVKVRTAKGINHVAYVVFDSIQVGDIVIKNIGGYVAKEGLSSSLLGMNFLRRLSKYEVKRGKLLVLWQ
ncbi:MAG: TIGR02281 family clan AA aspartic protease [Rickettsiales bacterium]|nr:TIGR02281 family clan AA aspartic protease [Rickettsiales bacterium]